jgi:hypothetical protein
VKKGALISIEEEDGVVRVKACSGPDHACAIVDGHKISLAPGQEMLLTASTPTESELSPADGVGRRILSTNAVKEGVYVTISDFSIISYVQNAGYLQSLRTVSGDNDKRILNSLLKTAAAIQTLSGAKKGAYKAKPVAQRSGDPAKVASLP